ncbi:hypothetical protein DUNSADRAFT_8192 [Dunaliella salina]|uniref:Dynein heavy chain n=1 Tax=Dunaliella salina TaxID=3046 RepID=A0ABQ7GJU5_DUNSA|nr:hypothetical protein DUNSADRAFT_8192 [Dunaliella salina]|eukprot:KAF5834888.1 hypothetical protein DUNSADRAFT_8192 [Dunaliella salina]
MAPPQKTTLPACSIADLVEPVPDSVVPAGLRQNARSIELFKEEFRAAQRLRSTEDIFIPEVVRTTHPPERAPHGVASNPAPSYVLPPSLQRPTQRKSLGPGHLSQPAIIRPNSPQKGPKFDWSENSLNRPNSEYLLSRQTRPDAIPRKPLSPGRPLSPGGGHPSALHASFEARMSAGSRPLTVKPSAQEVHAFAACTAWRSLSWEGRRKGGGAAGMQHMFHSGGEEAGDFIKEVHGDEEGLLGDMESRPTSAMYGIPLKPAAGGGAAAALQNRAGAMGLPPRSNLGTAQGRAREPPGSALRTEGAVDTMGTIALNGVVDHMRATSASLRRYNVPPTPSAISSISKTFARKPMAPHKQDARQLTPSERVASNFSPYARGMSPRTLEAFIPGGIKPGVTGQPMPSEWQEVDEQDEVLGVPEADGVLAATQGTDGPLSAPPTRPITSFGMPLPRAPSPDGNGGGVSSGGLRQKLVKRLNLRFKGEDPALHCKRVAEAKQARLDAEAELRLLFYLDALDPGVEEVLATYDFHAALARTAMQVRRLSPTVLEAVGRVLLEDVADYYERAVKKSILEYRRLDPLEENRLKVLWLPPLKPKPPAPERGMLPVTDNQQPRLHHMLLSALVHIEGIVQTIMAQPLWSLSHENEIAFFSTSPSRLQPMLLSALVHIEGIAQTIVAQPLWSLSQETPEFKVAVGSSEFTASEAGPPPFPLAKFEALQHSHLRQVIKFIELKLAEALSVAEDEKLAIVLNNGQPYEEGQPKGDAHAALLHLVRLRMADACYSLLLTSAEAYASSLETFQEYEPTPLSSFGVREVFSSGAFLRVALEEAHVVQARERAIEAARAAASSKVKAMLGTPLPSARGHPADQEAGGAQPSKDESQAKKDAGQVPEGDGSSANPGNGPSAPMGSKGQPGESGSDDDDEAEEEAKRKQAAPAEPEPEPEPVTGDKLVVLVPSPEDIADVGAGMFGEMFDDLAAVQNCFTADPSENAPLCSAEAWSKDATLERAKTRVAHVVALGLERAHEVASLFYDAAQALNFDLAKLLKSLEPMDAPLTKYAEHIGRLRAAAQAAHVAAPSEVWTGLLLVDTAPLKASLGDKAEAAVEALLSQLLQKSIDMYEHVCNRCEALTDELLRPASDTRAVLDLKGRLAAAEAEMDEMKAILATSKERDNFRIAYRHEASLDEEFAYLALDAHCWPKEMNETFNNAWNKVETEHFKFQDALRQTRSDLKQELAEQQVDATDLAENAHTGRQLQDRLAELQEHSISINEEEGLFGWERSDWPQIGELTKELDPYASLWHVVSEFSLKSDDWLLGSLQDLNPEDVDDLVNEWYKRLQRLTKSMPLAEHRRLAEATRDKLEEFRTYLPVISAVCNPGMRLRHWDALSSAVGTPITPGEDLQLSRLLKAGILRHLDALAETSDAASREHAMERQLDKMEGEWGGVKFELIPWKDTGGYILKGSAVEEAQLLLDDHTIKNQAMQSSPAAEAFEERIDAWVKKLSNMQDIFDAWLLAQAKWMYLGPVYGSEEIAKQMPRERFEFQAADTKWRNIILGVQRQPLVIQLIEILAEAKNPVNVQPFVKKIFEAVNEFKFNEEKDIVGLVSVEGENIPYITAVETQGEMNGVERWLLKAEEVMRKSLAAITKDALEAFNNRPRERWILEWPGQVVIAVGQVYWTKSVTDAMKDGGMYGLQQLAEKNSEELMREVKLVRGNLTSLERATIGALVVIDVHARDIVSDMVAEKVAVEDDFGWLSRLRYHWENGVLLVRMLNAQAYYGYEYLGNSSRLVITPLTDRCYRTLLGAHHLNLGGAPAGPAGTGKTETVKDLAKAVAIQCVVFNCSDGLDYVAMGKFFKGLAASGAWACFDEFNRIELEVLSVVAQQVLTIQRAKGAGKKRFVFEGVDLPLLPTCNVYITMNPGYAGRSELPDNLKALFRDVAMMVPDYHMIAEIMLYSYGYFDARSLAGKLVQTYRLCSEQLSRQDHYDYGMRAVMAVLRAAGNLKRKLPDMAEDVLMLRAITDLNLPKFLDEDVPLFKGILSDLFPGVALPELDYDNLRAALTQNAVRMNLKPLPSFLDKAIQLYEMIIVRHGLMLVGHSFGMKTSAIRVLAAALGDMCNAGQGEQHVKVWTINPKAVTLGQLYGQDDPVSKEWTDGVLAVAFRNAVRDTSSDRKWLVLDGPVDAVWIENMNTVLDDNKKLCLNSGEIIAMQGQMNMVFEVQDLAVASPATVSRCGMVYVQPSLLGWRPIVHCWMQTLPEKTVTPQFRETMLEMLESLLQPLLRLVSKDCKQPVVMQEINLVQSMVRLYESLLKPLIYPPEPLPPGAPPPAKKPVQPSDPQAAVENCLVMALIWGVGGTVDEEGRVLFSQCLRGFLKGDFGAYSEWVPEGKVKPPVQKNPLPPSGNVYDFVYDIQDNTWRNWMETVPLQKIDKDAQYSEVGPTGTGKSVYVKAHLSQMDRNNWITMVFNFSAQTSANMTQDIIDGKLDKRRKGVYGPPVGKKGVIFVDDLNMPQVEKYGAQPPIELLRQTMDHGGWYDRTDNSFRRLVDLQYISAMGPPGGGRNPVTNRFLRHFNVVHVTEFTDNSKTQIFRTLVDWWFAAASLDEELQWMREPLVSASLSVYSTIAAELLPTPAKMHYLFNLRDLSKVFQGMSTVGSGVISDRAKLVRLWVHEVLRVFHDRLVDDPDRVWICEVIKSHIESHFRISVDEALGRIKAPPEPGEEESKLCVVGVNELRTLLWGDFMIPGAEPPKYDEVEDMAAMAAVVQEHMANYNAGERVDGIVVVVVQEHMAAVVVPQMHMEAVAVQEHMTTNNTGAHGSSGGAAGAHGGGGGLAEARPTTAQDFMVFSAELSATYTTSGPNNNWHDDLKKAVRHAGEKHKDTVFLFSDTQIIDETMIEDISNLLNTGEVPNLFDTGDVIAIGEAVRTKARAARMDGSRADLYDFFTQEVRFTIWPDDALMSVASLTLQELAVDDGLCEPLAQQCMHFHRHAQRLTEKFRKEHRRHFYVTPTSYLQLLDCFKMLLARKREEVAGARRRYKTGLDKLASTELQVQGMQAELEALQPQLLASSAETADLMGVIEKQREEADKVKVVVKEDEAKAQTEADKVKEIKDECEADLAEAMPAYEAAIKALDTLTKNDISEVKGMKSPPMPVRIVMEAVCILKSLKPTKIKDPSTGRFVNDYWETSKKMLSDMNFLESLKLYDKDNIDPAIIEALQPLLKNPDFQPAKIKKVSQAAFGLCNWVRAMDTYDRVVKVVRPKKAALAQAEEQLAEVQTALAAKQAELAEVEGKLAELGLQLDAAKERKKNLEVDVKVCEEKLDRAQKLIGGLGGEKARWTAATEHLYHVNERLVGDMLLSAGMIAYLGAFPAELRIQALASWNKELAERSIPSTPSFSFITALGDPVKMRQWGIWGLPRDDVSASNGIIVHESKRWPLCIDPQGQANKWIRSMEASNKLQVLKPSTDPYYLRTLQASLPLGRPVLLEGIGESLDASLEPVLLKMTFKQAGVTCVKLGDSVAEWAPGFRLYMTTKLRNPHYPPEVCTRVCLLNFCITPTGLEDQLLGVVVAKERPDLEEDKAKLIVQGAENARKLKEIENEILRVLSASEGNILDDGEAVDVLQAAKKLSDEIAAKQKQAESTEAAIDRARTGYAPISVHVSILFFCVAELANIDPMYQYSLAYFMSLFVSPKAASVPKRLDMLRDHFTYFLFTNVCRSLFEKDKLLFAFALAAHLGVASGEVMSPQLRFLLTGPLSMDVPAPNPAPEWLSNEAWRALCELDGLAEPFSGLQTSVASAPRKWLAFYNHPTPYEATLPGAFQERLSNFQRLVLIRCLLPDKLVPAISTYVLHALGQKYVEPQAFKLDAVFTDSAAAVPLIFVLSFGSDPMADLLKFADERHKQVICDKTLGGEGPSGAVNPEFRLWLTSYPSADFPQAILENGLKITNEPPKGLRAGLERIYKSDPLTDPSFFEGCRAEVPFKNLMLGLAFFHCVVVGRRLYGPVGWNIPYTFNENDLRISMRQLRMFLDEFESMPLDMLKYTAGECNYGGKVTDGELSTYVSFLSRLPLSETPEMFGLHPNALITRNLQDTKQMLDSLLATMSQSESRTSEGGKSPEDIVYAGAGDILDKLPADFDLEDAAKKFPQTHLESMNTVLCQELGRTNALLQVIRSSLLALQKAVRGIVVMSSQLEAVAYAFLSARVPELWLSRSFPSLKPLGPYIHEVIERCNFFAGWLAKGTPTVFWISGFFFTQAFLTGVKQNFARKYLIPIDLIDFDYEVKDKPGDCDQPHEDGALINGLFLEAAAWDNIAHCLCESQPKVLFTPLPPMLFLPAKLDSFKDVPHYACPLYKTSERRGVLSTTGHSTNFVCDIRLPSEQPQAHWVMRGCAALTSLDA